MKIVTKRLARGAVAALATGAAMLLAGCGSSGAGTQAVPSLTQSAAAAAHPAGPVGGSRAAALHAAAQCLRQHGIPSYQDPVLTPDGQVYTDSRSIQDAPPQVLRAAHRACRALLAAADLVPDSEAPAPPQLVQAGVRSAECLRAHGLPNIPDPTAQSPYTPGHGFGFSDNEVPPGGKANPVFQAAARACRSLADAEIRASTLGSMSNDG